MTKASNADSLARNLCNLIGYKKAVLGSLWLWVAAGFLFLGLLWTGMFIAARQADTRSVPLESKGGR